ncbi:11380_t:CDS:2 [Ambispora gerdemannii]|uniref:11380_t:CDS:1 n=1 Tax=Ambispora gerdemannii TaxID=144530 RepID=A0A9N9DQ81_9GLOM|nr:11380_t:CDS:2 [Ambispora gerdemannii]
MATAHNLKGIQKNKPPLKESATTATNIANSNNNASTLINNDTLYDFDAPKYRTFNEDSTYGEDRRLGTPASPLIKFDSVIASPFWSKPPPLLPTSLHKTNKENNVPKETNATTTFKVNKLDALVRSSTKQKTTIAHLNNHHQAKGKKPIEIPLKVYDEFKVDPSDFYDQNQKFQLEPVRNSKNALDQLHRNLGIKKKNPCDDPLYNFEAPTWGDFNENVTFGSGDSWFDRHLPTPGQSLINTSKVSVAPTELNTTIIPTAVPDIKDLNPQERPAVISTPVSANKKEQNLPKKSSVNSTTIVPKKINTPKKLLVTFIDEFSEKEGKEPDPPKKSSIISTPVPTVQKKEPKLPERSTPYPKQINTPKQNVPKKSLQPDLQHKPINSQKKISPITSKAIVLTQKRQILKKRKSPLRAPPKKARSSLIRRKSRGVQKRQPVLRKNVTIPKPFKFHSTSRATQEKRVSYVPLAAQVQRFYSDRFKSSTMKLINHVNKNTIKAPRPPFSAKVGSSSRHDLCKEYHEREQQTQKPGKENKTTTTSNNNNPHKKSKKPLTRPIGFKFKTDARIEKRKIFEKKN